MQLVSITGVTSSTEIKSTKSIGALIFALDGLTVNQLATEAITAWVEKANGSNLEVATQIPLKDFIVLSTYGSEAVFSDATYECIAICQISDGNGAYMLGEGESFKFKLTGLDATKTYVVYGLEDAADSMHLLKFDTKVLLSDVPTQKYEVSNYDLLSIADASNVLSEINLYYSNGRTVKYTPFELKAIQKDIDPVPAILQAGTIVDFSNRLIVPLQNVEDDDSIYVTSIDFTKATTASVPLVFRSTQIGV